MNKCVAIIILCVLFFLMACKGREKKDKLAMYVSKNENGLMKKLAAGESEIVSQFIPEEKQQPDTANENRVYRFMVNIYTKPEKTTDSILYFFNYRSSDYFRLVSGADTVRPVLSERIANGRKDIHQFTVLFEMEGINKEPDSMSLLFLGNQLFQDSLVFKYAIKDIKKASKSLYGYE